MWKELTAIVDTTVSELSELCKQYPHSTFEDFFDTDELHERAEIRKAERRVIAECARYFKAHPKQLDRWAELKADALAALQAYTAKLEKGDAE